MEQMISGAEIISEMYITATTARRRGANEEGTKVGKKVALKKRMRPP